MLSDFKIFDIIVLQLWCKIEGVKWRVWIGAKKTPANIAACKGSNNSIKPHLGHRLAPFYKLLYPLFWSATLRAKNGMKIAACGMERATDCSVFFPCVPCVSAYILKQRSIGATSEMHLFPAKVGAKYAPGPTKPPRMQKFQQMSMVLI